MSDLHLAAQTTQKYGLPLTHLEYGYIEKCSNVKELEKILRVLRSGEEGRYPDLEKFTEQRLEILCPKSRSLRKETPISKLGDIGSGDWQTIDQDLKEWSNDMNSRDNIKLGKVVKPQTPTDLYEGDENLPPVRSTNIILEGKQRKEAKSSKNVKKKVLPRDYKEWDKVDVDKELQKIDDEEEKGKTSSKRSSVKGITDKLDASGLTEEEKERKANREKDKGNEAYRAGDYEESVTYYSRSISLMPLSASYNNRALAFLKLEKWDKAIKDCNFVLNREKDNVKALLRRGTAYKSKNQLSKGKSDFEKVLALESNNKKAESLLEEVDKRLQEDVKSRKEKGRRMIIEEVEESEEEEEIEVEKPMVNGYTNHVTENGMHDIEDDQTEDVGNSKQYDSPSQKTALDTNSSEVLHSHQHLSSNSSKSLEDTTDDLLSQTLSKDTKENLLCSENISESSRSSLSSSLPVVEDKTSAFEKEDNAEESTQSQSIELTHHSSSENTADEQSYRSSLSQNTNKTNVSEILSSSTSISEDTSPNFTRPIYVQHPLSVQVLKLKGEGNNLFRSGQYSLALQIYSQAISLLEKDKNQNVNISLLLSNRAACYLKTGNISEAVKDCDRSLTLVPHSLKSLLRRGAAFESLEVYGKAYVDYKHVLSIDRCVDQASQGASRCQKMLQDIHGQRCWREKIPALIHVQPWEVPHIVDPSSQSSEPSVVPGPTNAGSKETLRSISSEKDTPIPKESKEKENISSTQKEDKAKEETSKPALSIEEKFEQLKASGNKHVQKGEYSEAEICYSSCIALCPEQVACYTNRALCYIKLNKAVEADTDCSKALNLQPDNAKALYRRALARKMLQRYKLSMQDLIELLKLEPKNKAAIAEMEIVKQFYKEELEQLKQKKQEHEGKVRKRMKIEEVDDDDEDEKTSRSKNQTKSQSKSRVGKLNQPPSVVKSKNSGQPVMETKDTTSSGQSMPVAPPSAPRLMKTTPYEFCQAWNSLRPAQGIQPYAEILRQISPSDLPSVISNKLDGQMLQIIVRCVYEEMVLKGEVDKGYQILDNLCKVPRFSTVSMFLSSKEKKEVSSVLDILGKSTSSAYSKSDIIRLKKEYSVK